MRMPFSTNDNVYPKQISCSAYVFYKLTSLQEIYSFQPTQGTRSSEMSTSNPLALTYFFPPSEKLLCLRVFTLNILIMRMRFLSQKQSKSMTHHAF